MSKKVVTKKAQPATVENGNPPPPAATDVRVAQQLRVLETVAGKGEEEDKTYSPRTEIFIRQLTDVLDFFEYSRSDIASLVRRCHHDENQIQIAVANIVEDRANHEKEDWGTVKNKKQAKEERKIKEEEAKKEQERVQKEEEKQRKEAERKAAKEAREAERANKRGGKGGKNGAEMHGASALPPDPAILFAGTKPTEPESSESWQWWESSGDKWAGKSWDWQESWHGDDWGSKADAGWWGQGQGQAEGAQWEKAGSRKKGYKERKDAPPLQEEEEADGDIWDMPDTSMQPDSQGGLDQWTLGHLPGHERESDMPKAMPNALTVEALERDHLAVPAPAPTMAPQIAAPTMPPAAKPLDLPPAPQQDLSALTQPVAASSSSAPAERAERGGEKGKGKGKKGKGDREKGETEKERLERIDRSDDPRRQAVEQVGEVVTVRKHSSMGCAVVSMVDLRVRQAIVEEGNECMINGIRVQIKPHTNKETKEEVLTDLFVAWGRQVEKVNPLSEQTIAKYFDTKHKEMTGRWKAAEEEKREAEEREQQRLQEHARQEAVFRERTEQRRRYEQEEEQKRRQEAEQQKWIREQWMQQGGVAQNRMGAAAATATDPYAQLQQQQQQQQQQQPQQQAAAMQWTNPQQWMQAMAYQAQGWQMAQRGMMGMQPGQEYDLRAYYAQYMDPQRGQNAAYAQAQAQAPQAGYQNQQAFNYNAYARGERI
ncbi:unnamed protein product [Effrenium voratum]|uniref:Uncharacterized protein n=1 Tax=Effrenium voratum TaxID=2562239 RepID=A0AA36JJD5_9DINO|nr:unnamed protein product [Effrenium voratum]CAJ1425534.1 unnamed protein product [Effrenium voratum]